MPLKRVFNDINACKSADELFAYACEFFQGQGFSAVVYVAPAAAAGPYTIMECGMPTDWMTHYDENSLKDHDPIPGMAFQIGAPVRLDEILRNLPNLNADEQAFIDAFRAKSRLTSGLLVPTYGPYGRPALLGLVNPTHPALLDQIDTSYIAAVAQQIHSRMELLQVHEPTPGLSPREREILRWLVKGKSVTDIATILSLKVPTVATHIQRIYAKMQVNDRVNCVAKALARHYI